MQLGQRYIKNACRHEFQGHLCGAEKERPATHALTTAPHVMAQAQFFDFIEVDLDLLATHVSLHGFLRVQLQVCAQQVPGLELAAGHTDNDHAHS